MTVVSRRLKDSRNQEQRGAALHGGRTQPGSGNGTVHKGDVRTEKYLIEYKRTDGKSIRIKLEDLEKIRREAILGGRIQLLGFELGGRDYLIVEAADLATGMEECHGTTR